MTKLLNNEILPQSRNNNLVLQEVGDDLLLYDLETNRAYCLNKTAAKIWQLCDGKKNINEISKQISGEFSSSINENFVWLALEKLQKERLVVNLPENESYFKGLPRREIIKGIGLSSMIALPMVFSLVAPKAVNAASTGSCFIGGDCPGQVCGTGNSVADCETNLSVCCKDYESFSVECSTRVSCTCFAKCPSLDA